MCSLPKRRREQPHGGLALGLGASDWRTSAAAGCQGMLRADYLCQPATIRQPRDPRSLRSAYRSFSCGFGQPRATDHRCHLLNDKCSARSDGFLPRVKLAPRPEPKADPGPQSDSLWVHAFLCALLWQSILDWPHEAQNAQKGAPDIDHGFRGYRGFSP